MSSVACAQPADETAIPDRPSPQAEVRPVIYGHDKGLDACAGYGQIVGTGAGDNGTVIVRAAPMVGSYPEHELKPGQGVSMCDYVEGWHGIVFSDDRVSDCGTGSPIEAKREYDGPCKSGWVKAGNVELLAG